MIDVNCHESFLFEYQCYFRIFGYCSIPDFVSNQFSAKPDSIALEPDVFVFLVFFFLFFFSCPSLTDCADVRDNERPCRGVDEIWRHRKTRRYVGETNACNLGLSSGCRGTRPGFYNLPKQTSPLPRTPFLSRGYSYPSHSLLYHSVTNPVIYMAEYI